ncbi:hypothetical protein Nepgr_024295 [Nepenthes gracilis]|uniref:Malectin-like domain-containing protein n=1 Tax=Nepenthes gracilis TaxID=150966 RepID=A0AAD3XYG5_NEPGR|nr:hypothetical protein Nepgr_024295 [Nepenthes gracilis]
MGKPSSIIKLIFSLLFLLLEEVVPISLFSPTDNYLINCGSAAPTTDDPYNRKFTGDESSESNSVVFSAAGTFTLGESNPPPDSSPIYRSARFFARPSKYEFPIRQKGSHFVRLHFHRFHSSKFHLFDAEFHVLADGYLLLHNFRGLTMKNSEIREYVLWIDSDKLEISFLPSMKSKFAFVSAIEVISAPKDLILDTAQFVDSDGVAKFGGLSKNAFETIYRINVGGPKVTPFNDSLWRTWIPDDQFLNSIENGSKRVSYSGRIEYQLGGASREVAPDNVYNSARVISSSNSMIPKTNITLTFPIVEGYKYLVRTHFCDIKSTALNLLYFNVYVNGNLAFENMDLSTISNGMLASPFYADFVVDGGSLGFLNVSIGPSSWSNPNAIDAILNGIEVMKLNNSMGSLDGDVSAALLLKSRPRGTHGVLLPLVAVMCLLLVASVVLSRRRFAVGDSVAWSPLPPDVSDVNFLKCENQQFAGKLSYV